jgi:putative SOS response-associated peptidase YedK
MCNEYLRDKTPEQLALHFSELKISVRFPEGAPNLPPEQSVRISDRAPIVRATVDGAELVMRRWSWPSPNGKPVYNFRAEGRRFGPERCLIVADGFFEFTDPPAIEGAPTRRPKSKWLFTIPSAPFFCIAGIWRTHEEVGEAFTMLTTEPGPDVAPYHNRQVVVLGPQDWARWLNSDIPAADVLGPAPAGTLAVTQVR